MSDNSASILAFGLSCAIYLGFCTINRQLKSLKTEIIKCNRRDFGPKKTIGGGDLGTSKIDLLLEMHSVISLEPDVADVIQRVVAVAYNLLPAQRISVMVLNREKTHFTVLASKDAVGEEVDASKGIGSFVLSSGHMLNVKNAYSDPRFNPEFDRMTGFHTETVLCAPLVANDETIGVVYVINKLTADGEIVEFGVEDEEVLEYFAATASIAIKKAQLYHDAIRGQKNAQALLSIVRSRTSNDVLEKLLNSTIDAVCKLILSESVSVFICDQASHEAWACVTRGGATPSGDGGTVTESVTVKFGQGIVGAVASTGESIRIDDAYKDGRFCDNLDRKTGFRTKSVLCVAVPGFAANSKPVAVIQLMNKLSGKPFNLDDQESLEVLCKELSYSLRQKIEEISYLRHSTFSRDLDGSKSKGIGMEDSFLNEFGAVSQCYKFSAMASSFPAGKEETQVPPYAEKETEVDEMTAKCRENIKRWDFDPFAASDSDLMQYAVEMMNAFDLLHTFRIDHRKLKNFIMGAHALYHEDARFHNFTHAWSVMHMSFLIMRHGASQYLTPLDIFATLLASLCHDLDHPGTNNTFEVASKSELALTHSYDGVLERHHASMTHRLLCSPNSNILEHLSPAEQNYVHGVITAAIMATNMAGHFSDVEMLENASKNEPPFDVNSTASRRQLVGHIVHAADLSGQTLPLVLAKAWGDRCIFEFRNQAEQEKRNGYPVTEFMANLDTDLKVMRAQAGFVGNIVIPLWTALSTCFPSLNVRCCQAQTNHDYYTNCVKLEAVPKDNENAA